MNINECGAYERDVEQNWAASFAKRLVAELEKKHDLALEALGDEVDQCATKQQLVDLTAEVLLRATSQELRDLASRIRIGDALDNNSIATRHIKEGNVTTSKIHDNNVTLSKLSSDLTVYSTSPKKVGTWIDGTPIWRVAMVKELSSQDFSRGYYELTAQDLGVSISLDLIPVMVNAFFGLYEAEAGGLGRMFPIWPGEASIGYRITVGGLYGSFSYLKGWIEFVCPEVYININD